MPFFRPTKACEPRMSSSPDQRRAAAETVLARMRSAGIVFDDDPMVKGLIEEWINGWLDMPDVLDRYQQLLKDRYAGRRAVAASCASRPLGERGQMSTDDLLEQVEKLIGGTLRSPNLPILVPGAPSRMPVAIEELASMATS
jgi:hypothetical protein